MKLKDFIPLTSALLALAEQPLPFKYSYPVGVMLKKTAPELDVYETKRKAVADSCVARDEKGQPVPAAGAAGAFKIDPLKFDEYAAKLTELGEVEIDVVFPKIPVKDLEALDIRISGQNVAALIDHVFVQEPAKP